MIDVDVDHGKKKLFGIMRNKRIEQDLRRLNYYLVGGAVRDSLLCKEVKDLDFVVVGHTAKEMEKRGFLPIEAEFPVFLDSDGDEWALARTETKTGIGYTGFDVHFSPDVTLEEDLERRDFTINAIAYDPIDDILIDLFGGIEDLSRGLVRHVSEAYAEDPLRVMRFARFISRYGFDGSRNTVELSRRIAHELEYIPEERIFLEFKKAMLQAIEPTMFFETLKETDAFEYILPEVLDLQDVPAGTEKYHRGASAWEHIMWVVDEMYGLEGNNPKALLIAFFHDIGKGQTPEDVLPHHYGHEKVGADMLRVILKDLRFPKRYKKMIVAVTREHMNFGRLLEMRDSKAIRFVENMDKIGKEPKTALHYLRQLYLADKRGRLVDYDFPDLEEIEERIEVIQGVIDDIGGDKVVERHPHLKGRQIHDQLIEMRVKELKRRV